MNKPRSLRSVNLNLLPVLQALLREQSLVGASRSLALSQPAVHSALGQLRTLLGDPLLVRVGRRMVLTPRAQSLVEPVERACDAARRVVDGPAFDVARLRRCFIVAGSDYAPVLLGPRLMESLIGQAPGVSVHFVNGSEDAFEQLRVGDIDMVVAPRGALDALNWPPAQSVDVWKERFVHVVRADHPLTAVESPDAEQIAAYPLCVFEPLWYPEPGQHEEFGYVSPGRGAAAADQSARQSILRVEQFCALPLLVMHANAVAVAPLRLVESAQAYLPLQVVGNPYPSFDVALAWSVVSADDPAHHWFRQQVLEATT